MLLISPEVAVEAALTLHAQQKGVCVMRQGLWLTLVYSPHTASIILGLKLARRMMILMLIIALCPSCSKHCERHIANQ